MRETRRPFLNFILLLLAGFGIAFIPELLRAQATGGSALDPSELLRNLSPDQQDSILSRLGIGAGATGGPGANGLNPDQNDASQMQGAWDRFQRPRDESDEPEPLIPVLKGEDWVILEIGIHLPPRSVNPSAQVLQSISAQGGLPAGISPAQAQQALAALQASQSAQSAAGSGTSNGSSPPAAAASGSGGTAGSATGMTGTNGQQNLADLMTPEEKRAQGLIDLIRSRNPYQLSRDGVLTLPGFPPIPLLGLTEDQATLRLSVEPDFRDVEVRLTRLPLKKTGAEALKPFGYELFQRAPSTFAPITNIPVPSDYVVGPGDEIEVQLYGNVNRTLKLQVGRDGRVAFPELGPIEVGGQLFSRIKPNIESRVERKMIGAHASVSMRQTRSIRVFVVGEARRPGSYTISGLGTITSALYAAGGVKRIGSLRKVELKRQGQVVRHLDLYDLLMRGDTSNDSTLLQGDVVLIPPVGATVRIEGEVRRPAIYELKNESSVAELVELAGGLTPEADGRNAMLTRIEADGRRVVLQADLNAVRSGAQQLQNGDLVRITRLRPTLDSGVQLQGHVFTPGSFAWHGGMRLTDLISSVDELRPDADLHYVLIRRELPPDRRVAVLSADLGAALASPRGAADVELMARDRVTVFDLSSGRDRIIHPLMEELRRQSNASRPARVVQVGGRVKAPGEYPLEPEMTVADLVRAGGGLADAAAYGGIAELTRYKVENGATRKIELINIDLAAALRGDANANLKLEAFDDLSVKQVSQWDQQSSVTLVGEVRFPGTYVIKNGETLRSVIGRAGGLTEFAFAEGSVFTREELKRREQEQMDMLATRMQTDLTSLAIRGAAAGIGGGAGALTVGQSLLSQLRSAKAVGRLVIDLPRLVREPAGSADDVILRSGDQLIVPKFQQQVTVIGEVQSATSHLFRRGLTRDDYIALSGGVTHSADKRKIYVVRANGSVVASSGSRWFQRGAGEPIKPGDTIVVPLDTERMPALPFWQAVTSILYNVALGAAAIRVL